MTSQATMHPAKRYGRTLCVLLIVLLGGCRSPVYLMPTPEVMQDARFDVFADNPYLDNLDSITTYYATTRAPEKPGDPNAYAKKHGGALILGRATLQIGTEGDAWRALYSESTTLEERDRVPLSLVDTEAEVSIDLGSPPATLEEDAKGFFAGLNNALDSSPSRVLTIFVHGANNSFYESVARGAQLQYFTGKSDVAMTFAWPSAGSIWGYGGDVKNAKNSTGDFVNLLKLLAQYSTAQHINIIAYSAGNRIVSNALEQLGEEFPASTEKFDTFSKRRMNQVYMAASDEPLQEFATKYPLYAHLVDTITVTANPDDAVLGMASIVDGEVRLGSTGADKDQVDLTDDERERIHELVNGGKLDFIDMQIEDIEGFEYSHGAWYENPWLSTDVLVTLYIGLDPQSRGLSSYQTANDVRIWYFPKDYLSSLKTTLIEYFADEDSTRRQDDGLR